eukprot:TRINITY_DN41074_c0_g1_i1.p1 TRINITY_DN41074_c0_g1~~TRINITY_DN41074_c0_g1_i1.p1  ORF type:complete len:438 (+),score=49.93 TRINITY_DN41074_c0_g1_i1:44-1357(+)
MLQHEASFSFLPRFAAPARHAHRIDGHGVLCRLREAYVIPSHVASGRSELATSGLFVGSISLCSGFLLRRRCPHVGRHGPAIRAAICVRSSATGVDLEEARSALAMFIDDPEAEITATTGGTTNIVQYVDTSRGERFVLRIYNNGCDTGRVLYEHSVLAQVREKGGELPFELPRYMPSLTTGRTMMELPSGTQCCLSTCISGVLPKTADPKPLGLAAGQILVALSKVDPDLVEGEAAEPYYDIYRAHHSMSKDAFYKYLAGPELDCCRSAIDTMVKEFKLIDAFIERSLREGLPQQITHGDLHYDNMLCDAVTGEVTGLLDFEFASMDWRATELAVCLSKYVGETDPFPFLEAFVAGFAESCSLTRAECEALPDMINLRVMSNCVYFVGRAAAGEDSIKSLTKRADMYARRMDWVRENRPRIVDCVAAHMGLLEPKA